jgi:hypothetical protein
MPLNLASPGILVREVDLTTGSVRPSSGITGGLVGPFAKGPVDTQTQIFTENEFLNLYGKPYSIDNQYEYWMVAESYLSYGGDLRIVRADNASLKNAHVSAAGSTGGITPGIKIKSEDHYNQLGYDLTPLNTAFVGAKNPGSWANGIRVAFIDSFADQNIKVSTSAITASEVGYGVTQSLDGKSAIGLGTVTSLDGYYLKGIITGINTISEELSVKVLSYVSPSDVEISVDYEENGVFEFERLNSSDQVIDISIINNAGAGVATTSVISKQDWFETQKIVLASSGNREITVDWDAVAGRPGTTAFAEERTSRFDEMHIVIIDSTGEITGNAGTILEKHIGLSKATGATFSVGTPSYWRQYLATNSQYIFGLGTLTGLTTTSYGEDYSLETDNDWNQPADGPDGPVTFAAYGVGNFVLGGGKNYDGGDDIKASGSLEVSVGDISAGYEVFKNDEIPIDFILMGAAHYPQNNCQSLASQIIEVAEERKDCVAFISAYRGSAISDTGDDTAVNILPSSTITNNVVGYYSPIKSTTYAVFDSGYKYMYDRFNDTFRYVPLNGDIAGLCARTDINQFPWYSPAGTSRGGILNAVKLAYNPSRVERDKLYNNRINSVIFSPGAGIVLFGDKTGYAKASAFDRINVRRLFIYLEKAIERSAKDVLFEFNDTLTRQNFINTIEPFLRDVKAKRGIFDFLVVCDERNNTPAVIDNNEFIADIYIKPARSINFIGLTFVATKTGVNFEEIIGTF